jgi:hypothetical protein
MFELEFSKLIEEAEKFAKINCMNFLLTCLSNGIWIADFRIADMNGKELTEPMFFYASKDKCEAILEAMKKAKEFIKKNMIVIN